LEDARTGRGCEETGTSQDPGPVAQRGPGEVSEPRPVTADGGQDRAPALGWGEGVHPIRPKTIARYGIIPQKVTDVSIRRGKKRAGFDSRPGP
jgi:hypothetical protein